MRASYCIDISTIMDRQHFLYSRTRYYHRRIVDNWIYVYSRIQKTQTVTNHGYIYVIVCGRYTTIYDIYQQTCSITISELSDTRYHCAVCRIYRCITCCFSHDSYYSLVIISWYKKIYQNISFTKLYLDSRYRYLFVMINLSSQRTAQTICEQCYPTAVTSTTKSKQCPRK